MRETTLKQIAETLGISITTVSKALKTILMLVQH
jgi:predicted DNA binding protein